jgi:2-polyprenyl-6-methoxyphenol hydroxylase-like FAD-dependent oxidoreductase
MPERSASALERFDVAIAGGGPLGRTLARALGRLGPRGFRIALIEAEPAGVGRNGTGDARSLALSAASKNLLSALDLWSRLAPSVQPIETIETTDSALSAALSICSAAQQLERTARALSWSSMAISCACSPRLWRPSPR